MKIHNESTFGIDPETYTHNADRDVMAAYKERLSVLNKEIAALNREIRIINKEIRRINGGTA